MVRRLCDLALATGLLIALLPVFIAAALGIKLSSRGPIFYGARRAGLRGRRFKMYKFRTMRVPGSNGSSGSDGESGEQSAITAHRDPRVFAFGAFLRRMKIDELPQLFNILKGEMSFVGPRPEDPRIVLKFYASAHYETLEVLPGLASPGSIYNYTHGEQMLGAGDPERDYVERLLPVKLALDVVYVRHKKSPGYDAAIMLRTLLTIVRIGLGQRVFPEPPEMRQARQLVVA